MKLFLLGTMIYISSKQEIQIATLFKVTLTKTIDGKSIFDRVKLFYIAFPSSDHVILT